MGKEIGKGSFATVYRATHTVRLPSPPMWIVADVGSDPQRGGTVAIKSVNLTKLNKKLKDNLFSEIQILKELQHPHIVSLYDCRETSAHIHLVMEYCQLGDLSHLIKQRDAMPSSVHTAAVVRNYPNPPAGGLNEVFVRHLLQQLASALHFLRARNLIHRDVKPQNLLLIPSPLFYAKEKEAHRTDAAPYLPHENAKIPMAGVDSFPTLKIADFGFARSLPSTSLAETLCGSPLYMAPEILRYEKYDAKADLWSVGTVLYEMLTGRPPFRASNHVELLRKIEKGADTLGFPDDVPVSHDMQVLIRGLLKRNPVERMDFPDFFDNPVIRDEIPGLVDADRPARRVSAAAGGPAPSGGAARDSPPAPVSPSPRTTPSRGHAELRIRRASAGRHAMEDEGNEKFVDALEKIPGEPRPSYRHTATAPLGHPLHLGTRPKAEGVPMHRTGSRDSPYTATSPLSKDDSRRRPTHGSGSGSGSGDRMAGADKVMRISKEEQDRAAQDVAFERDYVVVEKRAVEVNALADELAASPRIHGNNQQLHAAQQGAKVRRHTTQATPPSGAGAQVTPTRAMQLASGKRPDHIRQASYERRLRSTSSTSSAISKAINLASGRLFSLGMSPPLGLGRGGPSPPLYSPFPAYPSTSGSLLMVGDGTKTAVPLDEDAKAIHAIEESATRSDVVYGFAEVKYKQLIPLAPSMDHGLGLREAGISDKNGIGAASEDNGLTVDAVVTLSEEALVLYVKALSLLARSMDIAGAWWQRKSRAEAREEAATGRPQTSSPQSVKAGSRVNVVVQWVRSRFNEVLEKAEFVRLKLINAQKRLPPDHPSHPNNHPCASISATGMGTSADNVVVSPGVSAEKLMYLRALEMSRSAAVNELVCQDLPGCEIAYVTAIRMLEAVLEADEELAPKRMLASDKDASKTDSNDFNPVNPEDLESVLKCKKLPHCIREWCSRCQ